MQQLGDGTQHPSSFYHSLFQLPEIQDEAFAAITILCSPRNYLCGRRQEESYAVQQEAKRKQKQRLEKPRQ